MQTIRFFAYCVLGCFLLSSCRSSAILTSKFESDSVGSLPNKTLPGDPAGDEITYSSQLEPRLRVAASASPGQKALQFSQSPASGLNAQNQWVGFRGTSTDFVQTIWYFYTATLQGAGGGLTVDVTDGSAGMIARMFIRSDGQVSLMRSFDGSTPPQVLGTLPTGVSHTVFFTVNLSTNRLNVSILKSGGNLIANDVPVLLGSGLAYANPARPMISFRYDEGFSDGRRYDLEEVFITRKQPN
ncbi:hypothetical protein [Larkinella soli]|uniref:hypothetical protein n=1 Tax=Larkinella soli TaxID=1770527 RepID=UPI000FFB1266|nr:hypothetical protein [Larkinella soli]